MHLVIIGGVAAGSKAAARARRVNPDIKITLFQDEAEVSYTACGQPYYLSGIIKQREALIIRKPAQFRAEDIEVKIRHKVTAIDVATQSLSVHDDTLNQIQHVHYDRLILATGARSIVPALPGNHLKGIVSLRSFAELDHFKSILDSLQPKQAVIAGTGYIALEMAESLQLLGIEVTLLGRNKQVFSRLDPEMSQLVRDYLISQKVRVINNDTIAEFIGTHGKVRQVNSSKGLKLPADLVLLALGTQPNIEIAQKAGIKLGTSGAIAVNQAMQTNINGVFACGDCAESYHRISNKPVWEPLGDIANLHGRVAGENAAGGNATFAGVFGTAICKTFDLKIGMTGLSEKAALAAGFKPLSICISARDKARYYPGTQEMQLKLIADSSNGRVLGAQIVGCANIDKTLDIAATALLGKLSCRDLENADLAYAPPFSPVLSPIIVAAGALNKKLQFTQ